MRRRDFIKALAISTAWPLAAHAQQAATPVIGYLSTRSSEDTTHLAAAFRAGYRKAAMSRART
jgi:putative tryptophan/tyrosine transport system substrate-binding protein